MSATIEYNGSTVATLENGEKATLPVANMKMASNIEVKVGYGVSLPPGYTQVEYIESTGTQYINTGVIGRAGIATALDFTIISGNLDDFIPMGCVLPNWSPRCYLVALQNGAFWSYALGEWQFSNVSASAGVRYLVETSLGANLQTMKVNGTTVKTTSDSSPIDTGLNVYLFGNNYSNSHIASGTMRVYSCKIYEGGTLVRDFIPCINQNGEAGLYDLVNGVFYGNSGSGEFAIGPVAGITPIEQGGTGATNAADARTNLGLTTETWTFTLANGSTVTKKMAVISTSGGTTKTFTIDGATKEFEEGMSWYQWVGSNYAPDSYSCAGEYERIKPTGDTYIVDRDGEEVLGWELIHAGNPYYIEEDA